MPDWDIGAPQIAALLVLLQRGLEELYSARNTRALLARGAYEVGRTYYPVVVVTHLAWLAGVFFLIPADATMLRPLIDGYLLLQVVRYWVIGTLGPYWTHRIITLEGAPLVKSGPYSFVRHPNYVVTMGETFLLPLAFGAVALAFIITAVWGAVLYYKIVLEDSALAGRGGPDPQRSTARK